MISGPASGSRDRGLQPERTGLAWQRTALAFLVLGLAALRPAWPRFGPWALLPAGLVVVGALALLVAARHRYLRSVGAVPGVPDGRLPLLAAGVGLLVGVLGAALLLPAP